MMRNAWVVCGMSLLLTSGCATMVRGEKQKVKVQTDPAGATVEVGGKQYTTPTVLELERKQPYQLTVSKDGYRTVTFKMESQWDAMSLGNVIVPGGSVGLATDVSTGADRSFYPLAVIKLPKLEAADQPPLELYNYRGRLLSKEEYEAAYRADHNPQNSFMWY